MFVAGNTAPIKFLFLSYVQLNEEVKACLRAHPEMVVIAQSNHPNRTGELRALVHEMGYARLTNPVIVCQQYGDTDREDFQIKAAADMGVMMIDGFTDGILLVAPQRDVTKRLSPSCKPAACDNQKRNTSLARDVGARSMICARPSRASRHRPRTSRD